MPEVNISPLHGIRNFLASAGFVAGFADRIARDDPGDVDCRRRRWGGFAEKMGFMKPLDDATVDYIERCCRDLELARTAGITRLSGEHDAEVLALGKACAALLKWTEENAGRPSKPMKREYAALKKAYSVAYRRLSAIVVKLESPIPEKKLQSIIAELQKLTPEGQDQFRRVAAQAGMAWLFVPEPLADHDLILMPSEIMTETIDRAEDLENKSYEKDAKLRGRNAPKPDEIDDFVDLAIKRLRNKKYWTWQQVAKERNRQLQAKPKPQLEKINDDAVRKWYERLMSRSTNLGYSNPEAAIAAYDTNPAEFKKNYRWYRESGYLPYKHLEK